MNEAIAETIRRADVHDEAILLAHLEDHSAVEWAETVAELRAELAAARAELAAVNGVLPRVA